MEPSADEVDLILSVILRKLLDTDIPCDCHCPLTWLTLYECVCVCVCVWGRGGGRVWK